MSDVRSRACSSTVSLPFQHMSSLFLFSTVASSLTIIGPSDLKHEICCDYECAVGLPGVCRIQESWYFAKPHSDSLKICLGDSLTDECDVHASFYLYESRVWVLVRLVAYGLLTVGLMLFSIRRVA